MSDDEQERVRTFEGLKKKKTTREMKFVIIMIVDNMRAARMKDGHRKLIQMNESLCETSGETWEW